MKLDDKKSKMRLSISLTVGEALLMISVLVKGKPGTRRSIRNETQCDGFVAMKNAVQDHDKEMTALTDKLTDGVMEVALSDKRCYLELIGPLNEQQEQ